ncbi:MAG: SDR family NAD(P)-dependent oxidoreductase [Bacteroidetes bacterium]|nr:MAG: SDR family NAD(P)-dependent oxidoreductase [Bacteroidota bacterium]
MSTQGRFSNPFSAVFTGVFELFRKKETIRPLLPTDRLDGKNVLVTGANSGLGFGIAEWLVRRGAHVVLACRSDIPGAAERLQDKYPDASVEMRFVDLKDVDSIHAFAQGLLDDNVTVDILIDNAGVTPARARKTPAGLDEMFMVNYLSKFILAQQLLNAGIIPNNIRAGNARPGQIPRMIYISSDSHQDASAIDFNSFGVFENYRGPNRGVSLYSYNKLILNTFIVELAHRLQRNGIPDVAVHAICPGPVNSNIIRDAPPVAKAILKLVFALFFKKPIVAAEPVIYMAAAPELEGATGSYLHMNRPKRMDEKVYDPEVGRLLWERTAALAGSIAIAGPDSMKG